VQRRDGDPVHHVDLLVGEGGDEGLVLDTAEELQLAPVEKKGFVSS
jgi:hypothetical protein